MPKTPTCATAQGGFADRAEFQACKTEMESYGLGMREYLACHRREHQDAIDQHNKAVDGFNRRLRGQQH
jgi:hypothetical protein